MLRHYVFLKYRDDTSDAHVTAFCERMLGLRSAIEGIQHLEIGRDELHDGRSWDLVLIMAFASVAALRAYQRHPQHLELMAFNDPFVANVAFRGLHVGRSLSLAARGDRSSIGSASACHDGMPALD